VDKANIFRGVLGVTLFIISLFLIAYLFRFFVGSLIESGINRAGVIVIFMVLLFSIFYLFSIAMRIMGQVH
jgi:hypothetical protein